MDREHYMSLAIENARDAANNGEVPVGCIITDKDGNIIASSRNNCENMSDATAHAEIEAIKQASAKLGSWRLNDCTLYVTLEPCPMCAGAIIQSRIPVIVYGAKDHHGGACGSVINIFEENFGHHPAIYGNVLGDDCRDLLSNFFRERR